MDGQSLEILGISRGDDGTAGEIGDGNDERIDRELRSGPHSTEELTGSDSDARVDVPHLDPRASHARALHLGEPFLDGREVPHARDVCGDRGIDPCREAPCADELAESRDLFGIERERELLFGHDG